MGRPALSPTIASPPDLPPPDLPIEAVVPELCRALASGGNAVLQAPPGAGKTTRVPLALLDQAWLAGRRIVMLEPRRLATRAAARRMAAMLGEEVGQTVGYRVRLDSRVGPDTRIEVVTDGLFVRRLQQDAALEGVGAVLFDEFHERSLDNDLGLALCLEAQGVLRDDLRLIAMSATLDGGPVARLLGDAPVITSEGRAFPVETRHLDAPPPGRGAEDAVAAAVLRALDTEPGNILVFLPGQGEIRRVLGRLEAAGLGPSVLLAPLYGDLSQEAQDRAIAPTPPGRRKVVLSTAIAETSLTIEGIRVVVDSGLMRVPRFDPRSGMTRLETIKVSQASAEQRRGRAGRLEPGVCYRLWPEAAHRALAPFTAPEILETDLAPLALELAQWGVVDANGLAWLDPPPAAALNQARDLLARLGALDARNAITAHGRQMAGLGVHPRLAHMMLKGKALGLGGLACTVAALLSERDIVRARSSGARDADLRLRVDLLRVPEERKSLLPPDLVLDHGALQNVRRSARQWQQSLRVRAEQGDAVHTGLLVALAYPDRVGQRRPGSDGQYRLANGRGAFFAAAEPLSAEDWLAIADLDGARREARIFLAAPVSLADLEDGFADQIQDVAFIAWDSREQAVQARRQRRLGELALRDDALPAPDPERVIAALIDGIRVHGLAVLPWTDEHQRWRARVGFLRRLDGPNTGWPDVADAALLATLEDWLAPFLGGPGTAMSRLTHLRRLDLSAALHALLPWPLPKTLDEQAPIHVTVPSGSRVPIDYDAGETPVLAVRLQEMFGATQTPTVAGGRVPLLLHLLSPARRPVQVTRDLASFWANAYREVKADMKGQYPRHYWPDNPLEATPTNRVKRRM